MSGSSACHGGSRRCCERDAAARLLMRYAGRAVCVNERYAAVAERNASVKAARRPVNRSSLQFALRDKSDELVYRKFLPITCRPPMCGLTRRQLIVVSHIVAVSSFAVTRLLA